MKSKDAEFIWSLMPVWVKSQPKWLSTVFYGTGSRSGDLTVANKVRKILNMEVVK